MRSREIATTTPELQSVIELVAGRECAAHSPASEPYFAAHRQAVAA